MMIIIIIISYDDFNYLEIDLIYFSAGPPPPRPLVMRGRKQ